ncbi:MFS transporter [Litchfieldella qijiaojingensis]|uniref:MFS transporter n=1 Tax=Litchfieldella qijiaojingensis TaxID=980347 RepID=A0ABQ2Z9U6_9GAMM|nr:MFS transporter [Halomonas qijiaojingensis]
MRRRFAPLFWTQSLGAFNDNFLRMVLLLLAWKSVSPRDWELGPIPGLAAAGFILPCLVFSSWGGVLGDRLDKHRLIRRLKLLELAVALGAMVAVWFENAAMLLVFLLLMGWQSALAGPVKYAILPQHLAPTELVSGNAWIGVGTFVALLAGVLLALSMATWPTHWARVAVMLTLVGVASLGLLVSFAVPVAPARDRISENWHPWRSNHEVLRQALREKHLFPAMLGVAIFWFLVTCMLLLLLIWVRDDFAGSGEAFSLLLVAFVLGVGVGSFLCAHFSAGRLEVGLVSLGALLAGAASLYLASLAPVAASAEEFTGLLSSGHFWQMFFGFMLVGIGAGLYSVPLYTLVQMLSREERRARMLGAVNMFNALAVALALVYGGAILAWRDVGLRGAIAGLGLMILVVGIVLLLRRPRPVLRLLVFALVHVFYRLRFRGRHHIPARGPALVVCNHVSFMDALVLGGASPRPLRFLMDQPIYESPWLNWWFRIVGAIPVDSDRRDPGNVRRALSEVSHALRQGEVVMLFPEGRLTPDGEIQGFRRGLDMILARDPVPVVPAGLAGLWGSWTSHHGGRALTKWPRRFRARVALSFGEPLSARQARSPLLERRVRELKADADAWVEARRKSPLAQS